MYYNYQRVCIDVTKMKTCSACSEKPIFFTIDDFKTHHEKVHQSKHEEVAMSEDLYDDLHERKSIIGQKIMDLQNVVSKLRGKMDSKVKVIRDLKCQTEELTYNIEYKTKMLKILFRQRKRIDEEYLQNINDGEQNEVAAWKKQSENEASQVIETLHRNTSFEKGERISSKNRSLEEAMEKITYKIDSVENEVVSLNKNKKLNKSKISLEEKDEKNIREELLTVQDTLIQKKKELENCHAEIQTLMEENKSKANTINSMQKDLEKSEAEIIELKTILSQKAFDLNTQDNDRVSINNGVHVPTLNLSESQDYETNHQNAGSFTEKQYYDMKSRKDEEIDELLALYKKKNDKYEKLKKKYESFKKSTKCVNEQKLQNINTDTHLDMNQSEDFELLKKELENVKNDKVLNENNFIWEKNMLSQRLEKKTIEVEKCENAKKELQKQIQNLEIQLQSLSTNPVNTQRRTDNVTTSNRRCSDVGDVGDVATTAVQRCVPIGNESNKLEILEDELNSSRNELSNLKDKYLQIKIEKTSLEQIKIQLLKEKQELEYKFNKMNVKTQKTSEQVFFVQRENVELKDTKEKLEKEISDMKQAERLSARTSENQQNVENDLKTENNCLKSENMILQCKCNDFEKTVKILKEKNVEMFSQHTKQQNLLEVEVDSLRRHLEEQRKTFEEETKEKKHLITDVENIQTSLSVKTTQLEQQTKHLQELGNKVLVLQDEQSSTENENIRLNQNTEILTKEIQKHNKTIEELNRRLESEINLKMELQHQCEEKEDEMSSINTKFDQEMNTTKTLQIEIKNLTEENFTTKNDLKQTIVDLEDSCSKLNKENEDYKSKVDFLNSNIDELTTKFEENVENLNTSTEDQKALREKYKILKDRCRNREEKLKSIKIETKDLKESWENKTQEMSNEIFDLKQTLSNHNLQESLSHHNDGTNKKHDLTIKEVVALQDEIKHWKRKVKEKTGECKKYETELEKLKKTESAQPAPQIDAHKKTQHSDWDSSHSDNIDKNNSKKRTHSKKIEKRTSSKKIELQNNNEIIKKVEVEEDKTKQDDIQSDWDNSETDSKPEKTNKKTPGNDEKISVFPETKEDTLHSDWDSDISIASDNSETKNPFLLQNTIETSSKNDNAQSTNIPIAKALTNWMALKKNVPNKTQTKGPLPMQKSPSKPVKATRKPVIKDDLDELLDDLEALGKC